MGIGDLRPADRALLAGGLGAGLGWGAATSALQTVLPSPWHALANAVSPWVAAAFVIGALARRPGVAAAAGLLVCWGETLGYYGTSALRGFGVGPMALFYVAAGVAGGPLFGWAGWAWRCARAPWAPLGAALLASVFLAEGAVLHGYVLDYTDSAILLGAVGAGLAVGLGLHRRHLLAVLGWCVPAVLLGAAGELLLVHVIG